MATKEDHYDRAVDCVADGDLEGAVKAYLDAIALDAGYADAWEGLAIASSSLGRHQQAIDAAKRLVDLTPEEVLAHTTLSRVYQAANMIAEAEEAGGRARILDWKRQLKEGGG
ncbi:MAG: tetratricopeptide repeat protein [Candidatus Binatia bacterium]